MAIKKANNRYDFKTVVKNIYIDIINTMEEDGRRNLLSMDDLLPIIAAPCTRLDFSNNYKSQTKAIMESVNSFVNRNPQICSMTYDGCIKFLTDKWVPTLSSEQKYKMISEFRMIEGFDDDGYAIYNQQAYNTYKRMRNEPYLKIKYASIQDRKRLKPHAYCYENLAVKTFNGRLIDGYWCVPISGYTADDWYNVIKDSSKNIKNMLMCYLQIEGHRASPLRIQNTFGTSCESINACINCLGRKAKKMLGFEIYDSAGNHRCWSAVMNRGRKEEDGFVSELRPEVVEAAKRLAKEENWEPFTRIDL